MSDAAVPGKVAALWRYPVSSMAGECLSQATLLESGIAQDRTHAMVDAATGEVAYPGRSKRWNPLPQIAARLSASGGLELSRDNTRWTTPEAQGEALDSLFGFHTALRPYSDLTAPRYKRAPIHLLTSAALRSLQALLPESILDERRFRPNLLVESPAAVTGIPEYDWIGRDIRIGNTTLRGTEPCARCTFTGLQQDGLPLDMGVYRTLLHEFSRRFGIYCEVVEGGDIRVGDAISLI